MAHATGQRYIVTVERIVGGEPIIVGTRTPVRALVELWRQGSAPEEIPLHLPHLTLGQVFDALMHLAITPTIRLRYKATSSATASRTTPSIRCCAVCDAGLHRTISG